jgi:hypothetical protein
MTDNPTLLVASWNDGVFVLDGRARQHELAGRAVRGLTADGRGGALAIVDEHALLRRSANGAWTALVTSDHPLSCCVASSGSVFVGTDDARVLRLTAAEGLLPLEGFDHVEGRETWTAGRMLVDGRLMGPPLGVRSIAATTDGVLLANVHVGGIPRSTDGGATWHPTIAVDTDVHEVRTHPRRPNIVAAASAAGLCTSRDGGLTWHVQRDGLHASYCSAVAFIGDDVLVAASRDHFAPQGRIYRRALDEDASLRAVSGLPEWTDGIVDTQNIDVQGSRLAIADQAGNVHVSLDAGSTWSNWSRNLPSPSSIHFT